MIPTPRVRVGLVFSSAHPETALEGWRPTQGVEAELRGRRSQAGAWERGKFKNETSKTRMFVDS